MWTSVISLMYFNFSHQWKTDRNSLEGMFDFLLNIVEVQDRTKTVVFFVLFTCQALAIFEQKGSKQIIAPIIEFKIVIF